MTKQQNIIKNNAIGSPEKWTIDSGFILLKYHNHTDETVLYDQEIEEIYIQFHFNVSGKITLVFNDGNYRLPINTNKSFQLYNPVKQLPFVAELSANSILVTILISIKRFHLLFSNVDWIDFLDKENIDKKYYQEQEQTPMLSTVLIQLTSHIMPTSIEQLYIKAKSYELLSLYFNKGETPDIEQCPFLADKENIIKLRKAKEIIIQRLANPLSLQELADEIELSVKKLKTGFKQIYGSSVFNFLYDYKMEYARNLMETGNYNVNELSDKIGYSTPSHFIKAFKDKFGTTPHRYFVNKS